MTLELILGASGLIGSHLFEEAQAAAAHAEGTYHEHAQPGLLALDVTRSEQTESLLRELEPDIVYMPAANPNVEAIERAPMATRATNVEAPLRVAALCRELSSTFVYYSSDYVFDGREGPYRETDTPHPLNVYGRQKVEVEQGIRSKLDDHLILRTTVVYGWEPQGKNFASRSLETLRTGTSIKAPVDQVGSPSYARVVAQASRELALDGATGTFHIAGHELCSRYEFACQLARTFGLPEDLVRPVKTEELSQAAARPLQAGLDVSKAAAVLTTPLLGYRAGLERMRSEMNHER